MEESYSQYSRHEQALSEYFLKKLSGLSGATLYGINRASNDRTPTFAIRLDEIPPEVVASALGEQNICVWNGHFYALGLIRQLGLEESGGVVRIGLMHYNTFQEIDHLFEALESLVNN